MNNLINQSIKNMKPILIYDTWNNNIKKVTDAIGTLTLNCGKNGRACGLFWIIEEEDEQNN